MSRAYMSVHFTPDAQAAPRAVLLPPALNAQRVVVHLAEEASLYFHDRLAFAAFITRLIEEERRLIEQLGAQDEPSLIEELRRRAAS